MTSQGASDPISAFGKIDASVACRVKGNVYISPDNQSKGHDSEVNEVLVNAGGGNWIEDWAEYRYIDFCDGAYLWKLRAKGQGSVSVMAEDYDIVGTQDINTEEFKEISGELIQKVNGIKSVWLLIKGQGISIDWFGFE